MVFKFSLLALTPSLETWWARWLISSQKYLHLVGFSFRLCSRKQSNTTCKCCMCSSFIFEKTITSSKLINQYVKFISPRQFCINLWNLAGALHSPNSIHSHSKNPRFPTVKAVYCFDVLPVAIYQKPTFTSKQEKYPTPTRLSMASCIQGRG